MGSTVQRDMSRKAMSHYDYRTLAAFRFAMRGFLSFSEAAARAAGLTPRQHQALLGIKAAPVPGRASVSDLASYLVLRHNSTVGLVDRLEAAGLVVRALDPENHRRVLVQLTAAGERCLADLSTSHLAELERIRPELQSLLSRIDGERAPEHDEVGREMPVRNRMSAVRSVLGSAE